MAGHASASIYSRPVFYDVEHYQRHNGLHVTPKRRSDARNIAIRVGIGVGTLHFPCSKREVPHFPGNLPCTETSQRTESDLDGITNHGGIWNAETDLCQTIYKVDIFSHHFEVGLASALEAYAK